MAEPTGAKYLKIARMKSKPFLCSARMRREYLQYPLVVVLRDGALVEEVLGDHDTSEATPIRHEL